MKPRWVRLREWLVRSLRVGKARRLRAETRAVALTTVYRQKLVAELHDLKILDVDRSFDLAQDRPFDLETSYVPLQVVDSAMQTSYLPEEALTRFRHLAVLGDPGAGKTTLLRYLTLLTVQGKPLPRQCNLPDFPLFVSLRHFAAVPQVNLLDFVISEIETRYGFPGLRPHLEDRLERGTVLFLLDSLDEVNVGRPQEAEANFRHVVGQINVLAARYPNCHMVVTARRGRWKGLLAASFHTLELLGFNRDDIQRFIVKWFGADSDWARDLEDALFQSPRMWALATNPLFLSLMALAFEHDGKLPEGRVGLYRRGVELLLREGGKNHHDLRKDCFLTAEQKRNLLEEVALHFHLERVFLFPEGELREVIASYLPKVLSKAYHEPRRRACPEPSRRIEGSSKVNNERSLLDIPADQVLPTVLGEISSQQDLLREQIGGWYGFIHPTWQEYFAAVAISKRGQLELVLESLHDPWWEGTARFLAGILEDAAPFLESILAQEEDIFYSNVLLAGRCLADISRIQGVGPSPGCRGELVEPSEQRLWEDITGGLKRLVEEGEHRLLQRQALSVLAEIGGGAVVSFFVALLRREEIDPSLRAEVAKILGLLHDKSVVPDLLAFLTDEKLDPSVRENIAEALGSLGDESVVPPLLALLPDERVDPSVRGRAAEALSALGDESVISPLLTYLSDEGIDPYVRERIGSTVLSLVFSPVEGLSKGDKSVVSQLLSLLSDEKIHLSVRKGVAEAMGSLGDESLIPDLLALLPNEEVEPSVREKAAEALGSLGSESAIPPLLSILGDEKVDYNVRMTVAEVLGILGDEFVASQLLTLLSDEKIDLAVRASIAGALGTLGKKSVIPQLLPLLPDEGIDPSVRWKIVDALSSLGEKAIIPHLRTLLPDERIDSSVRWVMAEALEALAEEPKEIGEWKRERGEGGMEEALGWLHDRSRVPQLLMLLTDEKIDPSVSRRIIEALGSLGDDRATVEGLAALLDREDIGSGVYEALFHVSQRAGMRVFARKGGGYEVRSLYSSLDILH